MVDLISIGEQIAERRRHLKLTQMALSRQAGVSRATLEALENQRVGELGFSKVGRILAALGLELTLHPAAAKRPTLDELVEEARNDQSLGRRG